MDKIVLGVDISKLKFDVCLKKDGNKNLFNQYENNLKGFKALYKWIQLNTKDMKMDVVMEATGRYGDALACFLYEKKYRVSIVNPAQIKYFANSLLNRVKTDKADSELIAQFGMNYKLRLWKPLSKNHKKLAAYVRYLSYSTKLHTQLTNSIEGVDDKEIIKQYKKQITTLEKTQFDIESKLRVLINEDEELKQNAMLLESIPGLGFKTTCIVLSIIKIDDFQNVKQLTAFAGLNPSIKQSGSSVRGRGSISKLGLKYLRNCLYFPAMTAIRWDAKMKKFADNLRLKGKTGKQIIIACMRKLLETIFWILKKQEFYNPTYIQEKKYL